MESLTAAEWESIPAANFLQGITAAELQSIKEEAAELQSIPVSERLEGLTDAEF